MRPPIGSVDPHVKKDGWENRTVNRSLSGRQTPEGILPWTELRNCVLIRPIETPWACPIQCHELSDASKACPGLPSRPAATWITGGGKGTGFVPRPQLS